MRIIAGVSKGKTLASPSDRTRPTSDRAREGVFSSLESEFASMENLKFLDLFSGSGAVGVEALSRGAALVHSVEKDDGAFAISSINFDMVKGAPGKYHIYKMSVLTFLKTAGNVGYDIIFMDPPYEFTNQQIEEMLEIIHTGGILDEKGLIAVERATKGNPFTWPAPLVQEKIRSYGQGSIFYGGYSASVMP